MVALEKRYQVFVSSTYQDLRDARQEVMQDHIDDRKYSWNQLFDAISPVLMSDVATDETIKKALGPFLGEEAWPALIQLEQYKGHSLTNFRMSDRSYDIMKVQFLALGLIAKNGRRAGLWSLTTLGERLMFSLRAIRKS